MNETNFDMFSSKFNFEKEKQMKPKPSLETMTERKKNTKFSIFFFVVVVFFLHHNEFVLEKVETNTKN